jgi:hypothetical protein
LYFLFTWFFRTSFRNTALPKNVPLFACELKSSAQLFSDNLFPPMLLAHQPFNKPMPITSARGINAPATYLRSFVIFIEGGGDRKGWDNNQFTALVSKCVPAQIPQLLPGSKEKLLG